MIDAFANKRREEAVLLKALKARGVVCRIRKISGLTRIDVFWLTPTNVPLEHMPFLSSMPLSLIKDIRANGFRSEGSRVGRHQIMHAGFSRADEEALGIAREIVKVAHGLDHTNEIPWSDAARESDDA